MTALQHPVPVSVSEGADREDDAVECTAVC